MSDKRMNAGYEITDSLHIGKYEFVIGKNNAEPAAYVTWCCTGGNNYFWGHYMNTREDAEKDLLERSAKEHELQHPIEKPKKRKEYER